MKSHVQAHIVFLPRLTQLKELEGSDTATLALRVAKEEEIGHLCYEVEEDLPLTELALLKDLLDLPRSTWEGYKQIYRLNVQKWLECQYHVD